MSQLTEAHQELRAQVEDFLYREARLLDSRRMREWISLCADDIHYVVPTRRSIACSGRGYHRPVEAEFDTDYALVDDNRLQLEVRLMRLESGSAWAEDPPSRTTRLVTNVEVEQGAASDEYEVHSCGLLQRGTDDMGLEMLAYRREDRLRRTEQGLKLVQRTVLLDSTVYPFRMLSLIL